jgi:hypothetical protein
MQETYSSEEARLIWRETSPERINEIINRPEVHRWVKGTDAGPLTEALANDAVIALLGQFGIFLFWRISPVVYEAQAAVTRQGKGKWALRAAQAAMQWVFEKEGAQEILAGAPKGDLSARAFIKGACRRARYVGDIENCWVTADGKFIASEIFSLTKTDWDSHVIRCSRHRRRLIN